MCAGRGVLPEDCESHQTNSAHQQTNKSPCDPRESRSVPDNIVVTKMVRARAIHGGRLSAAHPKSVSQLSGQASGSPAVIRDVPAPSEEDSTVEPVHASISNSV